VVSVFLLMLPVVLAALVAVMVVLVTTPTPASSAIDGFLLAHDLGPRADTRRAVERYVGRTWDFARRGMVLGLLTAVVLGIAWYQQVTVGFGASPLGDLLTMGLGGWFIGLLLSARYWHRPAGGGLRTAPLTPRDAGRYRTMALTRSMGLVAGVSAVLGVLAVLPRDHTDRVAVVGLGLVAIGAIGWAARTQARIAARPQPFVGVELLATDEAIRATSVRVIGLAAIGVGLVMIGWQASFVARGLVTSTGSMWWGFFPVPPLIAGLVIATRARRLLHPKVRSMALA
jgi:hypothetical protein